MARKPSRDMLTAGLVGSYLLASAWGLMLAGALVALLAGTAVFDFFSGTAIAVLAILSGLLWFGGAICEGIGWIGLGRLHVGLPRAIGWLEACLPVASVLGLSTLLDSLRNTEAIIHTLIILQILHYLLAFAWLVTRKPRGRALPAAIGYGLALVGGGGLYAIALARAEPEVFMTTLVFTGLGGATVAHLSTGLFLASQRVLADSVNTF